MKRLLSIVLTAILCATATAQTIRTLGYNSTNGQLVAATNVVWTNAFNFSTNTVSDSVRANLGFSTNLNTLWTATNASNARSAVELGLPALTNTSNVTMMRALSGSTNTNQPYSGTVSVVGTNNTNVLVFSNGVLQEVQ